VMSRVKMMVMALVALMVLGALGAVSASADEWFVSGALLKVLAKLASTAAVDEDATLLVPSVSGLAVLCGGKTLDVEGGEILPGDTFSIQSLKFLGCKTTKPATGGCELEKPEQTISTLPILGLADLGPSSPAVRLLLTPQTKSTFAEIAFNENNTCAFTGVEPVKGKITLNAPSGQTEEASQPVGALGSVENNSLEIGAGNKAFIDGGRVLLRLESGSKWSFHG